MRRRREEVVRERGGAPVEEDFGGERFSESFSKKSVRLNLIIFPYSVFFRASPKFSLDGVLETIISQ